MIKFCRYGQIHILSIWEIQRVHCVRVKENPLSFGSVPYYETYLTSGILIKLSSYELVAAYPEVPGSDRFDKARAVISALADIDYRIQKREKLGCNTWKYSDWIQERYPGDFVELCL